VVVVVLVDDVVLDDAYVDADVDDEYIHCQRLRDLDCWIGECERVWREREREML